MNVSFKSAASGGNLNVKSGNPAKTVGKVLVGSALLAGGLAVAAKTGKLDYSGHNKFASAVLNVTKKAGTKIADAAIAVKDKVLGKKVLLDTKNSARNCYKVLYSIGSGRDAETVKLYKKFVAEEKLLNAKEHLKYAKTDKVKATIQSQIDKLTAVVNG